jgi:glycosyltransferase involved in cell wall biosynthesis
MGQNPLVSIISPSFNQGAFIENTLLSISNQTYENIEHIVVDGGSTDATLEVLSRYAGTYNLRWISENDTGMYNAINKGLKMARGEIVAYLNTDDLYFPWTVSAIVATFARQPMADLVYGDMVSRDLNTGQDELLFFPNRFDIHRLIRSGWLGQPTVFFRHRVLDSVGLFDDDLKLLGDYDYWVRVGQQCEVEKCVEFLAVQTNHSSTKRQEQSRELAEEGRILKAKFGAPSGVTRFLWSFLDSASARLVFTIRMVSLARRIFFSRVAGIEASSQSPWSNTVKCSSFNVASWRSYGLALLPVVGRKHRSRFCRFH